MIIVVFREIAITPDYTFLTLLPAPDNLKHFSVVISDLIDLYSNYYEVRPKRFKLINDFSK